MSNVGSSESFFKSNLQTSMARDGVNSDTYWRNCPITRKLTKDWPDYPPPSNNYVNYRTAQRFSQYLKEYEKQPGSAETIIKRKV